MLIWTTRWEASVRYSC